MRKKLILRVGALVLLMCVVCAFATSATYADDNSTSSSSGKTVSEIQAEIKKNKETQAQIKETIKQLDKQISQNKNAAAAAEQLKLEYQRYADALALEIEAQLEQIAIKEYEINIKLEEIANKQQEFEENEENLKEIIGAIYKMNSGSPIAAMLAVDDFSQMLFIYENTQKISQSYIEKLDEIMQQKEDIEQLRLRLEAEHLELENERREMEEALAEYNRLIEEQKAKQSYAMQQIQLSEAEKLKAQQEEEKAQEELEELLKSLPSSNFIYTGGDLLWPVPSHNGKSYISSYFGNRILYGKQNFHKGVDIARGPSSSISGASIVAALDGVVSFVETSSNSGYGYYVIIDHGKGIRTLYAHCSSISVSKGTIVTQGTPIATVGNTGNSTGPHLHFELRLNETQYVDPLPYLQGTKSLQNV